MKKKKISANYLEGIPVLSEKIAYKKSDNGIITLEIENVGLMNKIAQKIFKKPKVSYVHLDSLGSFSLSCVDGERNIIEIGKLVEAEFGENANPLYERLAHFFRVLDSYSFIEWK